MKKSCYLDIAMIDVLRGNRRKVTYYSGYSFQMCLNNSSLSLPRFIQVCQGEVNEGKRYRNIEEEELDEEMADADAETAPEEAVIEANAKDGRARSGRQAGGN